VEPRKEEEEEEEEEGCSSSFQVTIPVYSLGEPEKRHGNT
jgi:hypothetical protein